MRLRFGKLKYFVFGIISHIMDNDIRMLDQILDNIFKILIKSALLGVKDQMFICYRKEAFIIGFFAFLLFWRNVCIQLVDAVKLRLTFLERRIIHMLIGINQRITHNLI